MLRRNEGGDLNGGEVVRKRKEDVQRHTDIHAALPLLYLNFVYFSKEKKTKMRN